MGAFVGPGPVQKQIFNNLSGKDVKVPIIADPRFIKIIVGGGPGAWIAHLTGGGATPGKKEIQKIEFPKNWEKLVDKYKDVEPKYAKY